MALDRQTMDFFRAQGVQRRRTFCTLVLFCLAVAAIVMATYCVAIGYWWVGNRVANFWRDWYGKPLVAFHWWDVKVLVGVTGVIVLIVLGGCVYKIRQLRQPAPYIMSILGGTPVTRLNRYPPARRLLNVVEEISIASGVPVPAVYVMTRQEGINALAVGWSLTDAAIAVTNGCQNMLDRDEMQGVIAHEFSHILNGDMRLNVVLMGILYGIDLFGAAGRAMFRALLGTADAPVSAMDNVAAMACWIGFLLCCPLLIVSHVGTGFGGLIRALVSRHREYLADAAAVQFTRYAPGIGGALRKIGGLAMGSVVSSAFTCEASHFFVADALGDTAMYALSLSTHPPLKRRVRALLPSWDGVFPAVPSHYRAEQGPIEQANWPPLPGAVREARALAAKREPEFVELPDAFEVDPDQLLDSVGMPRAAHLAFVEGLLNALPKNILEAARDPAGAESVLYGLLLNRTDPARHNQLAHLGQYAGSAVCAKLKSLMPAFETLRPEGRLPLVDVAISTLKGLPPQEYEMLEKNVGSLVAADRKLDLFEYALLRVMSRHLEPVFRMTKPTVARYNKLAWLLPQCVQLLSCLAHWGAAPDAEPDQAFAKGMAKLGRRRRSGIMPATYCSLQNMDEAVEKLARAKPRIKKRVICACAAAIAADGSITVPEAELLRAIADGLDCPMPPVLPGRMSNGE